MRSLTTSVLAAAGVCGLTVCGAARADVIYTLSGTAAGQQRPFVAQFDLTDAQVATGSFHLVAEGSNNGSQDYFSGDTGGFVGLRFGTDTVTPHAIFGYLSMMALTFGSGDSLASVDVAYQGNQTYVRMTGTGAATDVSFSSHDSLICDNGPRGCSLSASWAVTVPAPPQLSPVPEPATLALLGAGVLGLTLARRRMA